MAGLEVRDVAKSYGTIAAVSGFRHTFADGRITALLGPSGSGKSTLLWMLAGLTDPDAGQVIIDGADVTNVPAEKRDIGMVFQSYALFPHLTAAENVAFGLRARGVAKAERLRRAGEVLETVQMRRFADRRIGSLSGGEQQRVALARALAFRPRILLLDEPLSALDAKLREELRHELFGFLRGLAITTVYVTHDQAEALSLGDEIVVMREGRIEQSGRPLDVYLRPANPFVARFLGSANIVEGEVGLRDGIEEVRFPFAVLEMSGAFAPGPCQAMIRPEDLEVVAETEADFFGTYETAFFYGAQRRLHVRAAGHGLLLDVPNDLLLDGHARIGIRIKREKIVLWPSAVPTVPAFARSAALLDSSASGRWSPRAVN